MKWATELNRTFSKEEIQVDKKHRKKWSPSLAIKEIVMSAYWFNWVQRDSTQETLTSENRVFIQTSSHFPMDPNACLRYLSQPGVTQTFPQVLLSSQLMRGA
jgi:hypothetical protein